MSATHKKYSVNGQNQRPSPLPVYDHARLNVINFDEAQRSIRWPHNF